MFSQKNATLVKVGRYLFLLFYKTIKVLLITKLYKKLINMINTLKLTKETYTAEEVIELFLHNSNNASPLFSTEYIVSAVISKFGNRIFETRRLESFRARMLIAVLLKKHTKCTHVEIGMIIGRNHSSVSYYIKKFDSEMTDKKFAKIYGELCEILKESNY